MLAFLIKEGKVGTLMAYSKGYAALYISSAYRR